jgi:hypothetical protein
MTIVEITETGQFLFLIMLILVTSLVHDIIHLSYDVITNFFK